ncbi:MAG TPA: hypothetical protein VM282_02710 [Acidimicrobiales bacterium]|nr:hypothetical protein [Acidimicrobiales bacterium]
MRDPAAVGLPLWGKIAVVVAAILLIIVVAASIDFGDDEPDRPNLIGFDETTTTTITR